MSSILVGCLIVGAIVVVAAILIIALHKPAIKPLAKPTEADPPWCACVLSYRTGSKLFLDVFVFDVKNNPVTSVAFEFRARDGLVWCSTPANAMSTSFANVKREISGIGEDRIIDFHMQAKTDVMGCFERGMLGAIMNGPAEQAALCQSHYQYPSDARNKLSVCVWFSDGTVKNYQQENVRIKSMDVSYAEPEVNEAIRQADELHF